MRVREHHQPDQCGRHANGERVGTLFTICVRADERLKQRCGDLIRKRQRANLPERERVRVLRASDTALAAATASCRSGGGRS